MNAAVLSGPAALLQPITLADGRRLRVRPVLPQDSDAEQAFVMALSPASRFRRFHVGLRALPPDMLRQLTQVDHDSHVAWVAEAQEDAPGRIVADARYVRVGGDSAEFALAVADAWQRQGLGRRMLERLARHAARQGIRELRGDVLTDNAPMIAMLESMHCGLLPRDDEPGLLLATVLL